MTNDTDTKRIRLQRLIGLDDTKGVRGDLARARTAAAHGFMTAPSVLVDDDAACAELIEAANSADEDGPDAGGRALMNLCRALRRAA